jgi:hypothetical protein
MSSGRINQRKIGMYRTRQLMYRDLFGGEYSLEEEKLDTKRPKTSPWAYTDSINNSKVNLIETSDDPEQIERDYAAFLVNRSLSYFADAIHFVNVVNKYHQIDKKLQYEFLLYALRQKKRISAWGKAEDDEALNLVKRHFNYNTAKALTALSILTSEQLAAIAAAEELGGI